MFEGQMSSPAKICMNGLCGATTTPQWKKGWPMKAGGFATLCYACGIAYDNVRYCERFHLNEPGWRECNYCDKPVHCGCVVSKYLHECQDLGGILCIKCIRSKTPQPLKQTIVNEIPNGFARFSATWHPSYFDKGKLTPLTTEGLEKHQHQQQHTSSTSTISIKFKHNESEKTPIPSSSKDISSNFLKPLPLPSIFQNQIPENHKPNLVLKPSFEPLNQNSPSLSLCNSMIQTSNGASVVQEKVGFVKLEQKRGPKPSKLKGNKGMCLGENHLVARPPVEGRGRGQLLPRYWPKITDQELLQISGDLKSNCTVTPLFEKVLSASDAGRIGRLVLPKACAESYFPAIEQSEGVPIKIRDIKGREWTFQFRFWPNNNSRMYVLEGVTPCIQKMQLQAGDTVIFSRLDPENQLIIGFRKALISSEASTIANTVNDGGFTSENLVTNMEMEVVHEKKKARNIGPKTKRLHIHSEDAMELKFTWEEIQEFLRPPPCNKPTIVVIENFELEEYDEPPVFGKKTIFTTNASRVQEQWVQCDSCSKWRKLPSDVLIPSKWTCSDNLSDPNRCSCSVPEERGVIDLNGILRFGKGSKKRKITENHEPQVQPTGLDALATLAALGTNPNPNEACPTTRHPRHRPGCSCIVCSQPPSGKGNHKPNCLCNVCSTVKRRFKTLMLRRQKRLLEQESEAARKLAGMESGDGVEVGPTTSGKDQGLDLNCDPKEEEMMLAFSGSGISIGISPEWHDVLQRLVPNATGTTTSEIRDEVLMTGNEVIEGS